MTLHRYPKHHKNQAVGIKIDPPTVFRHPLTNWRLKNKLTMGKLARLLGVDISTISRWESRSTYPDVAKCLLIEYLTDGEIGMWSLARPDDVEQAKESLQSIDDFKKKGSQ